MLIRQAPTALWEGTQGPLGVSKATLPSPGLQRKFWEDVGAFAQEPP